MKEEYIAQIIEQLKLCEDLSLLDFIFQLFQKHLEQS